MLTLQNLNVHYGAIHALKGISFTVVPGEILSLIGANGAGKSTTLRAISGLLPCSAGEITFEGKPFKNLPADQRVGLGIVQVPEGRGIFANLTVEENLRLGSFKRRDSSIKDEEAKMLDLFPRLKERLWQNAGTLSGGEQQMLAIGRALMAKPKLLLLDEPSLGLAPQIIETIFETIQMINKSGTTILLVEQNALLALEVANRGIILETGLVASIGDSRDLLNSEDVKKAYLGH